VDNIIQLQLQETGKAKGGNKAFGVTINRVYLGEVTKVKWEQRLL
jgi:hypothetical protein